MANTGILVRTVASNIGSFGSEAGFTAMVGVSIPALVLKFACYLGESFHCAKVIHLSIESDIIAGINISNAPKIECQHYTQLRSKNFEEVR